MSDLNWTSIIEGKGAMLDIGATRLTLTPYQQIGATIDSFMLTIKVGDVILYKDKLHVEDIEESKPTALHFARLAFQNFHRKSQSAREALYAV